MFRGMTLRALSAIGAVCAICLSSCTMKQGAPGAAIERRTATVHRAAAPIKIDGVIDPAEWARAEKMSGFWLLPDPGSTKTGHPKHDTVARFLWDDGYLYFAFEMDDADVYGVFSKRDDIVCREDVAEIFVKPVADRNEYYEIEISPKETIFDLFWAKRGARGDHEAALWNSKLNVVAKVNGTLNVYSDVDKGWTLEGRIPFSDFRPPLAGPPKAGDQWSVNICRYDFSVDLPKGQELSTWSPHAKFDEGFHRFEDYGKITFGE